MLAEGGTVAEQSWTDATMFDAETARRIATRSVARPLWPPGPGTMPASWPVRRPTAMMFVRNPTGVSHSPAEFAERADCLAGVEALAATLRELAW